MQNTSAISEYFQKILAQFQTGHAKEHAYRPALQALMASYEGVEAVNDPKRSEHGNPDFIFLDKANKSIIRGYAEAKDIDVDLGKTEKGEQMGRYSGYGNLYLTNYREFRFYRNGEKYQEIVVAELKGGELILYSEKYQLLADELASFISLPPERIRSGNRLALIMGAKARRIRDNVALFLNKKDEDRNAELNKIYQMMRTLLVHDLSVEKFADMYAQTLVYGLFAARYNDPDPETFSREEARELVPASNPFLREFFDHIAGPRFDRRLAYIVDELCDVFRVSDLRDIITKHLRLDDAKASGKDPIIHFYEDFLKEYDPAERKKMGAYYTPIPVVRFIIEQVDRVLKEEFGLVKGLADTTKQKMTFTQQGKKYKGEVHKVQVLDPAVGTATFLNETIKFIHEGFVGQEGRWPQYAEQELIPRLSGFELMMAPYTIAHLKLGLTLQETGLKELRQRLGVYLTNTLEEGAPSQLDLFFGLAEAVTAESQMASEIKHERPIMVVMGNPPYSGVSSNETEYANRLIDKYKVEPGGMVKLQERKHWLNDDYVKFIAFAEDLIAKNEAGIVSMITNHGYLDNPTFRGMRWHLAQTFDKIYVLNLHGNSKKKEVSPDGSKDENIFDIQQGVAIIIGIKIGKKSSTKLAEVFQGDLWGSRKEKFKNLALPIVWRPLTLDKKMLYFVQKDITGIKDYEKGINVDELFLISSTGIVTMGDGFIVAQNPRILKERIERLINGDYGEQELKDQFDLGKNYASWVLSNRGSLRFDESKIIKLDYRPFDTRYTYFDNKLVWRHRENVMKHFVGHKNMGLVTTRLQKENPGAFIASNIIAHKVFNSYDSNSIYPLYLYHQDGTRTSNFNQEASNQLTSNLKEAFEPEDILDYCYGILHSPDYRKKYKVFLKTDFPRIPIPKTDQEFSHFKNFGQKLRELHLMESPSLNDFITIYPEAGNDEVDILRYREGQVWINEAQYFGNVPEIAWNFYIGGYQPAQKWLKDRKGQILSSEDIEHYQKIVKVLVETDLVMKKIDKKD